MLKATHTRDPPSAPAVEKPHPEAMDVTRRQPFAPPECYSKLGLAFKDTHVRANVVHFSVLQRGG